MRLLIGVALVGLLANARLQADEPTLPAPHWMVRVAVFEADADRLSATANSPKLQVQAAAAALHSKLSDEAAAAESAPLRLTDLELLTEQGVLREMGKADVAAADGQAEEYATGHEIDAIDPAAPDLRIGRGWIGLRGNLTATRAGDEVVALALRCEWRSANEGASENLAGRVVPRIGRRAMSSNLQLAIGLPVIVSQHSRTSAVVDRRFLVWRRTRTQTTRTFFVVTVAPAAG